MRGGGGLGRIRAGGLSPMLGLQVPPLLHALFNDLGVCLMIHWGEKGWGPLGEMLHLMIVVTCKCNGQSSLKSYPEDYLYRQC